MNDIDFSDYDLAVLEGGVNDYITGSPIGQLANSDFDKTTLCGAYQYIIEKILTDNPTIQIVMFTPYKVARGTAGQYPLSTYVETIETCGNAAIAFVGTQGTQIGWLASQADMLAEDWEAKSPLGNSVDEIYLERLRESRVEH